MTGPSRRHSAPSTGSATLDAVTINLGDVQAQADAWSAALRASAGTSPREVGLLDRIDAALNAAVTAVRLTSETETPRPPSRSGRPRR